MANPEENIKLTRVTVPIEYFSPISVKTKWLRKSLAEKGIDEDEIEKRVTLLKSIDCDKFNAVGINFMSEALLSHSAQKIFVVNLGRPITNETLSSIPNYYKSRIVWADKNQKIQKSVFEMLNPIAEDLEPIWETIRKEKGIGRHNFEGHEHGYCLLGEFLTTMAIASKYETEADVDLLLIRNAINRIEQQISSSESQALLARIKGIVNCYNFSTQIPCIFPKSSTFPNELLEELLDDSEMISLSKSRYLLGIPGKFKIAMNGIKQKMGNLFDQPKNRKRLKIVHKVGNIATKSVGVSLPEIETDTDQIFSSPLIPLNDLKPNCLKLYRALLSTPPPKKGI